MTSASVLHHPTASVGFNGSSSGQAAAAAVPSPATAAAALPPPPASHLLPATSLTSSTESTASSTGSTNSVNAVAGPALVKDSAEESSRKTQQKKKSRRRRTSDTLLATASAILKMLGVSSSSSAASASASSSAEDGSSEDGGGTGRKNAGTSAAKIPVEQQQQQKPLDKVMPAMPRAKSSSISDYEEMQEQLYEAKAKQHQTAEGSTNIPAVTTVPITTHTPSTPQEAADVKPVPQSSGVAKSKSGVRTSRSANDFRFGKTIGEGSFSTVYLAKDIHTGKEYAIKVCDKHHIVREGKQEYIKREREVMNVMGGCPGFVNLYCTFQDPKSLYFAMTYAKNGDLLPHINKVGSFDQLCTQFYAAELVLALENMHKRGVIHRDLKPENVLLDGNMHTLIADFGSAKMVEGGVAPVQQQQQEKEEATTTTTVENGYSRGGGGQNPRYQRGRKNSFVGTAQYVSPEILKGQPSTAAVDLWALGCIIYQMVSGLPPFRGGSEYLIFQSILKQELSFPEGFDATARDLVEKLLVLDPCARIGAKDRNRYDSIRSHAFFAGIDWERVHEQEPPKIYPYLPGLEEQTQTTYRVPDHLEPGLGEKQLTRLLGLDLGTATEQFEGGSERLQEEEEEEGNGEKMKKKSLEPKSIADVSDAEKKIRLEKQKTDKWDAFAEGELILKQGIVSKRKGLFARKRMLLLTTGPRLIYIDPAQMVKKGEIPWSEDLRVEPKNFKIFFVHTPNRTYYLEDPDGFALRWCDAIKDVRKFAYGEATTTTMNGNGGDRVTDYRYSSS